MIKKGTKAMIWNTPAKVKNLYRGASPDGLEAPRNVLFFAHQKRQALQAGARSSPQHHRFVLIANLQGEGRVAVDGSWRRLLPGEAMLVFPYEVHAYGGFLAENLTWVFATFELTKWEIVAAWRGRVAKVDSDWIASLEAAGSEWRDHGEKSMRLVFMLGDLLARAKFKPGKTAPDPKREWLLRVHEVVLGLKPEAWRIKDLARNLGISEPHLRAKFREEAGMGLGQYLRRVRLNRAAAMLAGLASSRVGEVARLCGYDSLYSFSRAFRGHTGFSPRRYRMKMHAAGRAVSKP